MRTTPRFLLITAALCSIAASLSQSVGNAQTIAHIHDGLAELRRCRSRPYPRRGSDCDRHQPAEIDGRSHRHRLAHLSEAGSHRKRTRPQPRNDFRQHSTRFGARHPRSAETVSYAHPASLAAKPNLRSLPAWRRPHRRDDRPAPPSSTTTGHTPAPTRRCAASASSRTILSSPQS